MSVSGITQLACEEIRSELSPFLPVYVEHNPYEDEGQVSAKAAPKSPDLAFLWRQNPRASFPFEAKVLPSESGVAKYVSDVIEKYLACRRSPFSGAKRECRYHFNGAGDNALVHVAAQLGSKTRAASEFLKLRSPKGSRNIRETSLSRSHIHTISAAIT